VRPRPVVLGHFLVDYGNGRLVSWCDIREGSAAHEDHSGGFEIVAVNGVEHCADLVGAVAVPVRPSIWMPLALPAHRGMFDAHDTVSTPGILAARCGHPRSYCFACALP